MINLKNYEIFILYILYDLFIVEIYRSNKYFYISMWHIYFLAL